MSSAARGTRSASSCCVVRRGAARLGSWEAVHGHIEPGETPVEAARRELREETGCDAERFYNLSRVDQFYLHRSDEVALIPVFVAFVPPDAMVRVSAEHDAFRWLSPEEAQRECTWPREVAAIAEAVKLLGDGNAGPIEDVLRID